MRETYWLEDFEETCQDIMEDAVLLEALSMYVSNSAYPTRGNRAEYFPAVLARICGHLSQHAWDLGTLEKRLEPDSSP